MKKGYFELGYLLLIVGCGFFAWAEQSRERMEAAATLARLRGYLTDRLGNEVKDLQALSDIGDIEHFLQWEGGIIFVVLYTVLAVLALLSFAKTELCSTMVAAFSRVWTWRP